MKASIFTLYTLVIVCIGSATIIEKYRGTAFAGEHIYGSWWFAALWGLLTVTACAYMLRQRLYKRMALLLLHLSFVIILAGALTTHLFARQGTVRLRKGVTELTYVDKDGKVEQLPFALTLKDFRIVNYPGTDAPLDYQSVIASCARRFTRREDEPSARRFTRREDEPSAWRFPCREVIVSMNNIGHIDGYRLFQQSYDSDGQGVTLGVRYDPWGIAITYAGYLMLLLGIIATLLSRHTQMRALYRKAMAPLALLLLLASCSAPVPAAPPSAVDKDIAHRLGTVSVLYNNRICPLNTVATDFVTKLSGKVSWQGYSADEVFVSWMIFYTPWEQQKLIKVKGRDVQRLLGIDGPWASYADFLNDRHEYKLQSALSAALGGFPAAPGSAALGGSPAETSIDRKALLDADEKFHLVEMFYSGQLIRMFPYRQGEKVSWYMPGSHSLPREIPVKEQFFIKQAMDRLTEAIVTGQKAEALEIIAKIKLFQSEMTGGLLPSKAHTKAELFYNALRSQKWPVFLALTLSLLLCVALLLGAKSSPLPALAFSAVLALYVTLQLALRWWLGGHVPVSNGPETMLFMAWVLLLFNIIMCRRMPILAAFVPLIASFCLLVAMLGGSSTQITPLMPVLQSPLLSIHVMTVMCAYALFALQVLLGMHTLFLIRKSSSLNPQPLPLNSQIQKSTALSQFLLYPAVFLLAAGIFLGAVWANVSWGNYWSWDPKESWALITLMVYAIPLHKSSVGIFQKPLWYHLYMVAAFLAVLITYFGVNYLLGGMHSYA